jgi:hypothetical protein
MNIVVLPELEAYIDPLTADEEASLERSLLAEGCRDALILWGDILVDGHNRYRLCRRHGLPFQTLQHPHIRSMEDVHLWMIEQHLGRRSLSDFQRGVLALRKKEILEARLQAARGVTGDAPSAPETSAGLGDVPPAEGAAEGTPVPAVSREAVAKAARLSASQVQQIEKIQKQAVPEVVAAVRSGNLSISAAATLATLPEAEQHAAAAGGESELKETVKRVRQSRQRKPKGEQAASQGLQEAAALSVSSRVETAGDQPDFTDLAQANAEVRRLRALVADLQADIAALRTEAGASSGDDHDRTAVAPWQDPSEAMPEDPPF